MQLFFLTELVKTIVSKIKKVLGIKKKIVSQVLVAYIYNPSYSGGRDKEDLSSTPVPSK
jgi:hypothetical protein